MARAMVDDMGGFCIRPVSDEIGKGVFALRDYCKGESIFRERPLVSGQFNWNATYGYSACSHCLTPLETAQENVNRLMGAAAGASPAGEIGEDNAGVNDVILPYTESCCSTRSSFHVKCPSCNQKFCSQNCLNDALFQYHKVLCVNSSQLDHPINLLDELWKSFHYPPESSSITLIQRILATVIQEDQRGSTEFLGKLNGFMRDVINHKDSISHKLLGDQFQSQIEQLRNATIATFGDLPSIRELLTPEGFSGLIALIGRNGQGIGTSAFGQWTRKVDKLTNIKPDERDNLDTMIDKIYDQLEKSVGMDFLNNEGSGLYYLQSACNHSCLPNAIVEFPFNNYECVLNATRNIKEGEEILISYLDECELSRSRHSRLKALAQNYLFTCNCSKCQEQINDPDVTSEEEMDDDDEEEDDQNEC